MLGTGMSDGIMEELLGNDMNGKFPRTNHADTSDILDLENSLQSEKPVDPPVRFNTQTTDRRTRGVDVSFTYLDILSKEAREEREREINPEPEQIQSEIEVIFYDNRGLNIVHIELKRTYTSWKRKLPRTTETNYCTCK